MSPSDKSAANASQADDAPAVATRVDRETASVEEMPAFALALQMDSFAGAHAEVVLLVESGAPDCDTARVVERRAGKWTWFDVDAWNPRSNVWITRKAVASRVRALEIARTRAWLEPEE